MPALARRALLLLLVFSPALFTAELVREKAVDVGCWDMWENAPLLQKWHDVRAGRMSWTEFAHHLYSAQIQHRIVVPRLLIIALTTLSGGDFRWEQYGTFLILLLDAALLGILLRRTAGGSPWRWPVMFAINLLVFSPIHYQILFWGSSLWGSIPVACLLGVLVLLGPPARRGFAGRVAASVLLAEIATHSFAHGLALWPVLLALVLLSDSARPPARWTAAAAVLAIGAVTLHAYFQDFINTAHHAYDLKPGDPALKGASNLFEGDHLRQAGRFFLAFTGAWFSRSPFTEHPLALARTLGAVTFALWAAGALIVAVCRPSREQWRAALPWLALAAYAFGVGLMISKRGVDIGEHRAVTPRYLAISQYVLVSMLPLALILARRPSATPAPGPGPRTLLGAILLSAFITAQIPVWQYGLHLSEVWYHARRQAQALVLFLPHLKPESLKVLDKEAKHWHCLTAVNTLRSLGWLHFKPLPSPELKWFRAEPAPLGGEKAALTRFSLRDDGSLEIAGHARFSVTEPADAVLAVLDGRVIGIGQPAPRNVLRIFGLDYEFANLEDQSVASMHPWNGAVAADALPAGPALLELWALDVKHQRVARLRDRLQVDRAARTVARVD